MNLDDLKQVPNDPGVYFWKDKYNNIIYVGKAKNLNKRMKQYFNGMNNSYKTPKLVKRIASFEYVITSNEKEALVLERNLIEKHTPEYNIILTDDKRYPYIMVSLSKKVEIKLIYRIKSFRSKKAFFYGPFPTGFGARRMANLVSRLALYDKGILIKDLSPAEWKEKYDFAKDFLSKDSKKLIKELEVMMVEQADKEQFEIAHDIKELLKALRTLNDNQAVELKSNKNIDAISFIEKDGFISISLLYYRRGILLSKNDKIIEITSNRDESVRQFISQYYHINQKPDLIISNLEIETDIEVVIPRQGINKKILEISNKNANDNLDMKLQEFIRKEELTIGAMAKLEKLLGIENIHHIIMIDNSTTNNSMPVSAIVSYRNGIKQKHEYRKFNLEQTKRKADVEYMKQGITRYFIEDENKKPDLLIVDGGIAQVNEVKKITPDINIIGLVKNEKHLTEALITSDGKRIIIKDQNLFNFLKGIQIEVDRFAKYVYSRKRKTTLEGVLATVEGIGPSIEKKLLKEFKTYSAIYNASQEELESVVSKKIALSIKKRLI
ncbi:MAG: GIY-YIG nuclease family protein [Mycoplasmataceae bacterium]|nr:GIY-YIG nuclease family protein [Mycoplasmataceae bacterium]